MSSMLFPTFLRYWKAAADTWENVEREKKYLSKLEIHLTNVSFPR